MLLGRHPVQLREGLVHADEAELAVEQRHPRGSGLEEGVEPGPRELGLALVLFGLAVEAGVLDRVRRPMGELLGEAEVALGVAPVALGVDQGDGADHALAAVQRHDDRAAQPERAQDSKQLRLIEDRAEQGVGNVWPPVRLTRADDPGKAMGPAQIGRVAPVKLMRERDLLGVGVRDRDPLQGAVVVEQIDGAPVGEARHDELGDASEGQLAVERAGEDLARFAQEGDGVGGAFLIVDVGGAAEPADDAAARVAVRHRPGQVPAVHAVRAPKPELALEGFSGREGATPLVGHHVGVVWVANREPDVLDRPVAGQPGVLVPAGVEILRLAVARAVDDLGKGFAERLEALLGVL